MEKIETLVREHASEIHGYLCRMVGDYAEAKDILSEVFIRATQHARRKPDNDICKAWLYRVATNLALSYFRKRKVRRMFAVKSQQTDTDVRKSPQDELEDSEDVKLLKDAISKLGHKHRSVILMRMYQELSYEEMSKALGIKVGTVKSRLNEAKAKLKALMENRHEKQYAS